MAFEYAVDPKYAIVHVRVWGTLAVSDHTEYTRRILSDPSVPNPFVEVVSFVEIDDFDIQFSEYAVWREEFSQLKHDAGMLGTVLIAPPGLHHGMARMMEGMAGNDYHIESTASPEEAVRIARDILKHSSPSCTGGDPEDGRTTA
ncbi:MAG: hypothetical protein GC159_07205 [Phycisphaera sp.]|nr:hypothetical protein [Phycisphaera sp.]